jgi:molybdate transport system ATP-binding protein
MGLNPVKVMVVLSLNDFSVHRAGKSVLKDLHFSVKRQMPIAIVGPSGSGKTSLLEALAGKLFYTGELYCSTRTQIAYVPQQHHFRNLSHTDTFYYQQRFNSFDAEDAATVAESIPALFAKAGKNTDKRATELQRLFALDDLKERRLLQLSNGEHKRLQLAQALLAAPHLLLLDAPFTGLDSSNRLLLEAGLAALCAGGMAVVLTCSESRIPQFVQEVLKLDGAGAGSVYSISQFRSGMPVIPVLEPDAGLLQALVPVTQKHDFSHAVKMSAVQVCYNNKTVLQDINWEVRRGQRWSLSGPNGAGKSTLLSLITADNPQAYANDIFLFDRRRGTGESIWEIKQKIGFVSPELHLHFDKNATVFDAIASGFFDTIGLFRKITGAQKAKVDGWLQLLDISHVAHRMLWQQPLGTQRLVLLSRALVKAPPLLVLDEPLQGLDEKQAGRIKTIVDLICSYTDQTLVFVSHYADDLPGCIDRYLKLEDGKIASVT